MESVVLLDRARQAGLVVLHQDGRLIVRGPKRLADLASQILDCKAEVITALNAEADPGVAMALEVFTGATVTSHAEPVIWPPPGAWLPSPPRTIDPYTAEMPAAQCPVCGALAWHRAGDGWTCGACHPPRGSGHVTVTDAELDTALFGLAERAGFPGLPLSHGVTVLAGRDAWSRFARDTTCPSLRASAVAALLGRQPGEEC